MHDHDFTLVSKENLPTGKVRFTVRIEAMDLERRYEYDPEQRSIALRDDPILVAGHDMTSITGKRVREWLRVHHLDLSVWKPC